jgi:hypothetical protein
VEAAGRADNRLKLAALRTLESGKRYLTSLMTKTRAGLLVTLIPSIKATGDQM